MEFIPVLHIETLLNQGVPKHKKMDNFISEENFHPTHGIDHTDFKCVVCFSLHDQLKKCKECENFICISCLNKLKVNVCPFCNSQPYTVVALNHFEKSSLDRLILKCNDCTEEFSFKERRKHMQKCA